MEKTKITKAGGHIIGKRSCDSWKRKSFWLDKTLAKAEN